MPEVVPAPANASADPGSIVVPDVETSKVPRTIKGKPWVPVPGTSRYEWMRGTGDQQEFWRIVIFFRRLNFDTHEYEDMYVNTNMLSSIDPNDQRFRLYYNKWILQFARRRDSTYSSKVTRIHWTVGERRALYTAINTFCAKFGINRFCFEQTPFTEGGKLTTKQLQLMADAVNAAPNPLRTAPRGIDSVRGQIITANDKTQPKNKAIFDLNARAVSLRARIENGEKVPRAERKPQYAIALSEFPVDPPAAVAGPSSSPSKKRKHTAEVEDSEDESIISESISPPASGVDEDNGGSQAIWMSIDEEILVGESAAGYQSDTDEEVVSGEEDQWADVDEATPSPPAKKLRAS